MENWLTTYWPIVWAIVSTIGMVILVLLSKTYAKREDLEIVKTQVSKMQSQMDNMPTKDSVMNLRHELAETRGEMKELRAMIKPVEHMAQLLLEQRLNDDK